MKLPSLITLVLGTCLALFSVGCASIDTQRAPNADLTKIKSIYVVKLTEDERGVNQAIADQLAVLGYQATTGEANATPAGVDATITYQDKWMWDITMYMIELQVQVRKPDTNMMLVSAKSYRPSLQRKSIEGMVEEVLVSLFNSDKSPQ
jgi:hypothetical protein